MKRSALVATLAIILTACESAAPVEPTAGFSRDALLDASGAAGVCNAVFAQLENRGTVEEHVLAAAARQNAELIQQLQAERGALESDFANATQTVAILTAEIARAQNDIAAYQAAIAQTELQLAQETDPEIRALLEAQIQSFQAEQAQLQARVAELTGQQQQVLAQLFAIESRIAEIDAQLARGGC